MSQNIPFTNWMNVSKILKRTEGLLPLINSLIKDRVKEGISIFLSVLESNLKKIVGQDAVLDSVSFKSFPTKPYHTMIEGAYSFYGRFKDNKTVVFGVSTDVSPQYTVTVVIPYIGYVDFAFVLGMAVGCTIELTSPISFSEIVDEEKLSLDFSTLALESLPLSHILVSAYNNRLMLDLSTVGYSTKGLDLANLDEFRKSVDGLTLSCIYALLLHNSLVTEGDMFLWAQDLVSRWRESFRELTFLKFPVWRSERKKPIYTNFYFKSIYTLPQNWKVSIHATHYGKRTRQRWAIPLGEIIMKKEQEGRTEEYLAYFEVNLVVSFYFSVPIKEKTNLEIQLGIRVNVKSPISDTVFFYSSQIEDMFENELKALDRKMTVPVGGELPPVGKIWGENETFIFALEEGCKQVADFVGRKEG